jgi:hypothetical protein
MYLYVYVAIVLCLALAVIRHPSSALAALLCIFALKQWAQSVDVFFTANATLTNYVVAGLALLGFFTMVCKRLPIFRDYPTVGWLVISLFLYSYLSVIWVSDADVVFKVWVGELPYVIMLILVSPLLLSSTESVPRFFHALLPLGTLLILLLLFTSTWAARGVALKGVNVFKSQGNPLALAEMAGYVMAAVVLLNFRGTLRSWQLLRWLVVAACLALAAKSGSRGQFFVMMIGTGLFIPMSRKITNPVNFIMLFVGITLLAFLGDWAFHEFSTVGDSRWHSNKMEKDVLGRFDAAGKLLGAWSQSPFSILFGLGNSASFDRSIIGFYCHVVPLEILGEEGLVGFCLFLSVVLLTLVNLARGLAAVKLDAEMRGCLAAMGAIFLFELVLCCKQGSMMGSPVLFTFMILIGKFEVLLRKENTPAAAEIETGRSYPASRGLLKC